jgi:hypothetical protein
MRLVFKTALNNPEIAPIEPDETLKVWVLYENAALCNRALALLNRVTRNIEGTGLVVCAISRLSAFGDPLLAKILAHETGAADLIIIAASGDVQLPHSLKNLISLWLATRAGRPTALAAVFDAVECRDGGGRDLVGKLAGVARIGGLDFFCTIDRRQDVTVQDGVAHTLARSNGAMRGTL